MFIILPNFLFPSGRKQGGSSSCRDRFVPELLANNQIAGCTHVWCIPSKEGHPRSTNATDSLKRETLFCQVCFAPDLGVAAGLKHLSRALCVIRIEIVPVALVSRSLSWGEERVGDTVLGSELMKNEK